jgi:hypothetical protein
MTTIKIKVDKTKVIDWKITLKKVAKSAVIVALAGSLAVMQEDPVYLGLIPVVEGLLNVLKRKWGWGI